MTMPEAPEQRDDETQPNQTKPGKHLWYQNNTRQATLTRTAAKMGRLLVHRQWDQGEVDFQDPHVREAVANFAASARTWEQEQQDWRQEQGFPIQGIPFGGSQPPGAKAREHTLMLTFVMCAQLRDGETRAAEQTLRKLLDACQALAIDMAIRQLNASNYLNDQPENTAQLLNHAQHCWGIARNLRSQKARLVTSPEGLTQARKTLRFIEDHQPIGWNEPFHNRWARALIQAAQDYRGVSNDNERAGAAKRLLDTIESPLLPWSPESLDRLASIANPGET